ncbi:helix-turn-helix domain-containing protein [Reyranella sp.]|uniref:helix-turn-helix domain-containing protein n=1 Tax=Reyranella sp. TaxID=1929291 RepID=UPI00272F8AF6|nr:helix-turn-helix domain-containing protein [Reyranella sp.]MDP2376555.1 helix-turn-helix domain-containing protein [Reyranella sp.]
MTPRLADIIAAVATVEGVPVAALTGRCCTRRLAWPRQRGMYVARRLRPEVSWPRLGRAFHRHHTTVMHGARAVTTRLAAGDPVEARRVAAILAALQPPAVAP